MNDRKLKENTNQTWFLFVGLPPSTCKDELETGVLILPPNGAPCANTAEHTIANRSKDSTATSLLINLNFFL